ncbi:hypothetical protein PMAYCL1PPCAC_04508, partial [Pristionchus mayeri]
KKTPDLSAADEADPTTMRDIQNEINDWNKGLQPYLDQWIEAYSYEGVYAFTDLTNQTTIKDIMGKEMNELLHELDKNAEKAGTSLHTDLYEKGESCRKLYRSYSDAGDLACKGAAGPVQGMWTAAGLAALFFLPLGLSLLFISNAYRNGSPHAVSSNAPAATHSSKNKSTAPVEQHQSAGVHAAGAAAPPRVEVVPA